ncbi:Molybdenum ABC transporter, periplasmic molybdenum-binding protein ModA [Methanosarcina horonobensis HB-1 = JCM 15518]|uniref:Molybdenum ABC transporter, periplasmic molybdenum-binding protein ModA n=2 Tax=Methanosarcina horonobensis TaxID=418008 RepID=A0A0E3SDW9_9EURY|nr:molybdate ABC transporter substrate-binding protein [Methanosarcina horonobensis]AKB80294.1 Molybdenum ABC transporter, periplasmic molybdenum-binding protein ModA [Methanosarcina horonobensis HB-1 = JCM 15518]
MKKVCTFIIIMLLAMVLSGSGCAEKGASIPVSENQEKEFTGRQITVCSGAGLIKPMNELIANFENETGADIEVRYGGSAEIFGILTSKECDVFIPGDYFYTGQAMEKNYVFNESVANLTLHVPVIAVPEENPANISGLEDLANPRVKLALGDPNGPAIGRVSEAIFTKAGILPEVENNTIVKTATVNQLLIYVVSGEVDATIIWEDMASWSEASGKLEIIPIPEEQNKIKTIPTAVSIYTEDPELAEAFNVYIAGEEAEEVWEKWGFEPCDS